MLPACTLRVRGNEGCLMMGLSPSLRDSSASPAARSASRPQPRQVRRSGPHHRIIYASYCHVLVAMTRLLTVPIGDPAHMARPPCRWTLRTRRGISPQPLECLHQAPRFHHVASLLNSLTPSRLIRPFSHSLRASRVYPDRAIPRSSFMVTALPHTIAGRRGSRCRGSRLVALF